MMGSDVEGEKTGGLGGGPGVYRTVSVIRGSVTVVASVMVVVDVVVVVLHPGVGDDGGVWGGGVYFDEDVDVEVVLL